MALSDVLRPGHVGIRVTDMDAAVTHYTEVVGLIETGRDSSDRVYLKAWDEHDHHSVVLRQAETPGMDYMAFKVIDDSALARLEKEIEAFGCSVERIPANEHLACGERVRFQAPTGHSLELFAEKERVGNGLPSTNPDPWPDDLKGMQPARMDHCLLYGEDLDESVRLFREVRIRPCRAGDERRSHDRGISHL